MERGVTTTMTPPPTRWSTSPTTPWQGSSTALTDPGRHTVHHWTVMWRTEELIYLIWMEHNWVALIWHSGAIHCRKYTFWLDLNLYAGSVEELSGMYCWWSSCVLCRPTYTTFNNIIVTLAKWFGIIGEACGGSSVFDTSFCGGNVMVELPESVSGQ